MAISHKLDGNQCANGRDAKVQRFSGIAMAGFTEQLPYKTSVAYARNLMVLDKESISGRMLMCDG